MASDGLRLRLATMDDLPELRALMGRAIGELLGAWLPPEAVAAAHRIMGIDTQLIVDGTYFAVEAPGGDLAGCGGWGRRATTHGGDGTAGRDPALLDPARDAARIRAMYTHPGYARRGVGRLVIAAAEAAARAEGFRRAELVATPAGEPLYRACGYAVTETFDEVVGGVAIPLKRMAKDLTG